MKVRKRTKQDKNKTEGKKATAQDETIANRYVGSEEDIADQTRQGEQSEQAEQSAQTEPESQTDQIASETEQPWDAAPMEIKGDPEK